MPADARLSRQRRADPRVLTFRVAGHLHALPVGSIVEVIRAVAVSPLLDVPAAVDGVVNYHGRLVPVVDLRSRIGAPREPPDPEQHFVIASDSHHTVALRVDRAEGVLPLEVSEVKPASALVPEVAGAARVGTMPDGTIVVHDLSDLWPVGIDAALAAAARSRPRTPEAQP